MFLGFREWKGVGCKVRGSWIGVFFLFLFGFCGEKAERRGGDVSTRYKIQV